jgi:hypothetical protein
MNDELSVLDYIKALLTPWRGAPPPIPPLEADKDIEVEATHVSKFEMIRKLNQSIRQ